MSDFKLQLIFHSSPTIYGLKQGNLRSLFFDTLAVYKKEVPLYPKELVKKQISLDYLYCSCIAF